MREATEEPVSFGTDAPRRSATIAPAWHTVVLIAAILAVSASGATRLQGEHREVHRLGTYGITAAIEMAILAWVWLGLRLKKTPLRALLGTKRNDAQSIALDLGIAAVFWLGSLMVLGTLAITWSVIAAEVAHRPLIGANGQPTMEQERTLHTLERLAPANGEEMAAWALLCVIAGFVEETVFRGYFQRQFTAWGKGSAAAGVVFSALMFGAAHGYEGARTMFLIAVFGALFSLLAIFRGSLRPGIVAHCWHDLITGLALAILKSQHIF
jgi:uncharacterized protein